MTKNETHFSQLKQRGIYGKGTEVVHKSARLHEGPELRN